MRQLGRPPFKSAVCAFHVRGLRSGSKTTANLRPAAADRLTPPFVKSTRMDPRSCLIHFRSSGFALAFDRSAGFHARTSSRGQAPVDCKCDHARRPPRPFRVEIPRRRRSRCCRWILWFRSFRDGARIQNQGLRSYGPPKGKRSPNFTCQTLELGKLGTIFGRGQARNRLRFAVISPGFPQGMVYTVGRNRSPELFTQSSEAPGSRRSEE